MIVIVDDSALFRLNVREAMEKTFDTEIVELDTVRSMNEFFSATPPGDVNLVILDLNLPDGNGLSAMDRISKSHGSSKIPFIIISKQVNRAIIPLAKKSGAADILAKPINPEELIETIIELFPDVFIPLEKRNKSIEEYTDIIQLELKKAKKGDYPLGLFLIEVKLEEKKRTPTVAGRHKKAEKEPRVNLKMRLSSRELGQVFPLSENLCLVVMPYVGNDQSGATRLYLREVLEDSGLVLDDDDIVMASAVYPEQGAYVADLIYSLKNEMLKQKSGPDEQDARVE